MDSQVQKFLREEKANNTDKSHKVVAKKFRNQFMECRLEKDPEKKVALSAEQEKAIVEQNHADPPYQLPSVLIDDTVFARFLLHCLLKLKCKKSSLRQAHGYLSYVSKGKIDTMINTENVYARIKRRAVYKHHVPKKALVPKADVHVNLGVYSNSTLYDAYAIFIYNLAVLL